MVIKRTTSTKEAQEIVDNIQYDIVAVEVDNLLTEVGCNILEIKIEEVEDGAGGKQSIENPIHIGYIKLQNGRTMTEISSDEDMIKHITVFSMIVNELKGKVETKTTSK